MIACLVPNIQKTGAVQTAARAAAILHRLGAEVLLAQQPGEACSVQYARSLPRQEAFAAADWLITVGGDGTILHAAKHSLAYNKPILGVNLGRTGFLATCELDELEQKLSLLVQGQYTLDQRMLLDVCAKTDPPWRHIALNDTVLYKSDMLHTIDFSVYCDGILVNHSRGDGVIVATPTGSTAYSLSAGGPILDAAVQGIVVTPICAHSLQRPPMVFSASRRLTIQLDTADRQAVYISSDGAEQRLLPHGCEIEIAQAQQWVRLISFHPADQFQAIDQKLKGR